MNSPCVNCHSYPCACHGPFVKDGRYTFSPFTYEPFPSYNPYQPHMHCVDCYSHPCVCMDNGTSDNGPTICCAICYHHPCSCHMMTCGCLLGLCQCSGEEVALCFSCGNYETKCICEEELSEEEPRELHDVVDCPCGCGEECILMKPDVDDPWAHRSSGMRCTTCMWYVQKGNQEDEMLANIGRCRRHAPTMNGYPVVYETDWCGDHKLDETKT